MGRRRRCELTEFDGVNTGENLCEISLGIVGGKGKLVKALCMVGVGAGNVFELAGVGVGGGCNFFS
jgi:hypothetical protein